MSDIFEDAKEMCDETCDDCIPENIKIRMDQYNKHNQYEDQNETITDSSVGIKNFKIGNLPIILNSDSYADISLHIDVRMKKYLNMYPCLREKTYILMPSDTFSFRFNNWMNSSLSKLTVWGDRQCYLGNVFKNLKKEVHLSPDNKLVKIDDDVYFVVYEEYTLNRMYQWRNIIFVDGESTWDNDKIRNWIISFSKKLKEHDECEKSNLIKKEAFDGIFLPEDILSDITGEIDNFLKSKNLYKDDLRLPWKRGYMLIGPPGNGKTSLIRAICQYWGLKQFDIQKAIQKDGSIRFDAFTNSSSIDMMLYPSEQNPVLCIMEDIDKFIVYQSGGSKGNADVGKVTLHDILKGLDGLDQYDGVIVMATTNYARDMSEAILNRPGRFDRIWRIDLPTEDNILNLLTHHNIEVEDGSLEPIVKGLTGFSMAFVAEFVKGIKTKFRRNKVSESEAAEILDKIHKHNKIYLDYFKGRDDDHRDSGSVGFGS